MMMTMMMCELENVNQCINYELCLLASLRPALGRHKSGRQLFLVSSHALLSAHWSAAWVAFTKKNYFLSSCRQRIATLTPHIPRAGVLRKGSILNFFKWSILILWTSDGSLLLQVRVTLSVTTLAYFWNVKSRHGVHTNSTSTPALTDWTDARTLKFIERPNCDAPNTIDVLVDVFLMQQQQ